MEQPPSNGPNIMVIIPHSPVRENIYFTNFRYRFKNFLCGGSV